LEYHPIDVASTPSPINNQTSAIYRVHGHWAKRPFNVVRKCIEHFSHPGEIVFDPFGGFGSTGIEALTTRRKAVIFDINPISVFIAKTVIMPYSRDDLTEFTSAFERIEEKTKEEILTLYKTKCPNCGKEAIINTTVFDSKNDENDPRKRDYGPKKISFSCGCQKLKTRKLRKHSWKKPSRQDVAKIMQLAESDPSYWFPKKELIRNSRINVHEGMTIADLYTGRNLHALSILWNAISNVYRGKANRLMRFTFSAILRSASKMVHEGGGGWQNNFHIPKKGLAERNVWDVFTRKKKQVVECKKEILRTIGSYYNEAQDFSELEDDKTILIQRWDATETSELIPNNTIDYVHTDPPYGDNIPYLELFLPNIYWIGLENELDNSVWQNEIIITDSPDFPEKNAKRYYDLLTKSFVCMSKVLRPNRWVTAWFACTDEEVWKALTDSFQLGGLEKKESYMVRRTSQQRSFSIKAREYRNPLARILKQDLLIHCQRTGSIKLIVAVPKATALKMFIEVAESETRRRGTTTSGELYIALVNECLKKFGTPPPNLNYEEILGSDPRFIIEEVSQKFGKKVTKTKVWKLKGLEHPHKLTYFTKEG
jgi:16S rRNA G966 N2-methylase RsmD